MSFLKKSLALVVLLALCGFAAMKWDQHAEFERIGERLVRQLGDDIVTGLGEDNRLCRGYARVDAVTLSSDWPMAEKGSAAIYISGRNGSSVALHYAVESAGQKVYVRPIDPLSARAQVVQFAINGCS